MKKVLINAVSAKSGGALTYIQNLINCLNVGDKQFFFVVPNKCTSSLDVSNKSAKLIETDIGFRSFWHRLFWDQVILRRIVRREKIDVLVSTSDFGMLKAPCSQILMVRNALFFSKIYRERYFPKRSFKYRIIFFLKRWLVILSIRSADLVVTASKAMMDNLQQDLDIPPEKVLINPFGVPLDKFFNEKSNKINNRNSSGQEKTLQFLYVSEYGDYKNLTTLLKAVYTLAKRGIQGFHLVTTLDPEQFPNTEVSTRVKDKELSRHPSVASHVTFVGAIPYNKIEELYKKGDVFVFPSLVESFGYPLVEAMAMRLPIIASDIPIHREICNHAAIYFDPLNSDELADKIVEMINHAELRDKLGSIGARRAKELYNWTDHVSRFIEMIDKL